MFRTVVALIRKEFIQVRRDHLILRMIFIAPILQLFVLAYAISTDVKYVYTATYDYDRSQISRELIRSMSAGEYFVPRVDDTPLTRSEENLRAGEQNVNLIIPPDFSRRLLESRPATIGLVVDGANANSASIALGYANLIALRYGQKVGVAAPPISLSRTVLYNPEGESLYFMVPGIVAVLLTMITMLLSSLAIVRERERGTLEQLMVTPMRVTAMILGKTIPFAILGYLEMSGALAIGILWFGIPFAGSWLLLYGLAFLYLLTALGVGIFVSTISNTQQQAMFFTWFFAIFTILTSGFFIPIENMPYVVQKLTYLNPLRYFMIIVRGIMMKGAGLRELHTEALALVGFSIVMFGLASLRFVKRVS